MPNSVSHTSRLALRTTYCVPAIESRLDKLACGTKRSVREAWARPILGMARLAAVAARSERRRMRLS